MRATLEEVLTEEAFARMIPLAERWTEGVEAGIADSGLPWHVTRLGCRAEYLFGPDRPRTGQEAHDAGDAALERYMHLFALNRGILLTPFHNMALMSPATTRRTSTGTRRSSAKPRSSSPVDPRSRATTAKLGVTLAAWPSDASGEDPSRTMR